jgi:5-formyltetrahydrofolate cyclo-ligase
VPGLAFDSNGHRLGQGKGYYDRFILKIRRGAKPYLVGVCLEEQFLNEDGFEGIPVTDHDFIMDMVITPSTTMTVSLT